MCKESSQLEIWLMTLTVNPLSPNGDQQQLSPNNVHTLSRDKVVRIWKMITKEKMPWCFIKFSQLILKGNVWRSVWRICMWILGLKGLSNNNHNNHHDHRHHHHRQSFCKTGSLSPNRNYFIKSSNMRKTCEILQFTWNATMYREIIFHSHKYVLVSCETC